MEEKTIAKSHVKRLLFDIPTSLHCRIKSMAAEHNMSMKKYILQTVVHRLDRDEKYIIE